MDRWRAVRPSTAVAEIRNFCKLLRKRKRLIALELRIVVRLQMIESDFTPRANPLQPSGTQCHGYAGGFLMDGVCDFGKKRARIGQSQSGFRRTLKLRDGPFRFVHHFPRKQSGVCTEFAEQRDQNPLQQRFAPAGELQGSSPRQ